jgi:hypothetical protein
MHEKNYYNFNNRFILKKIKIGPFTSKVDIDCKVIDFNDIELFTTESGYQYSSSYKEVHDHVFDIDYYYYKIEINQKIKITSDINLSIFNKDIKMNSWLNLFFVTLENFIYIISSSKHNQRFQISNLRKKKRKRTITHTEDFFINKETGTHILKNPLSMSTPKMVGLGKQKKLIEMNDLDSDEESKKQNMNKNYFDIEKNNEEENNLEIKEEDESKDENKVEFDRCFDCNYFWINNIVRDEQKIINFIKTHTKFKDDNIENLNLNSVYEFFSQENKEVFDTKEKKIKFRIQSFGIDNYARIKNLNPNFRIVVTYLLE